jgi:cytochrome c-type biogenesis protein CcmH
MHKRLYLGLGVIVLLLSLIPTTTINAQDPTPSDDDVNRIAKQLYCPVCENIPLDVCPTQACEQWRGIIYDKLALGWDESQIKQYFVDQYGDRVLSTPPATGFNWLIYVLPPLAFVAGAGLLFRLFKNWKETPTPPRRISSAQLDGSDDPYVALLEEQLKQREMTDG